MADAEQIRATIDAYTAAYGDDREGWVALFADDARVEDPVGSEPRVGRAAIAAFWDETHALSDAVRLERTGPVRVAAGEAAFPMQAVLTMGDATMALPIIDVMTFDDDGRITSMRAFWDMADLAPIEG